MAEKSMPSDSAWAELREAQTMALKQIANSGQAVAIDLGEANDIHPRNKQEVGGRLARLALAGAYEISVASKSARFDSVKFAQNMAIVKIKNVNGGLQTWEGKPATGFALAGADQKWHWARAEIIGGDQIKVHSTEVERPVAVRYAWADNPVCNVYDTAGLPLTPFRTDDWEPYKK
jgi:sialate O-acetylesterase